MKIDFTRLPIRRTLIYIFFGLAVGHAMWWVIHPTAKQEFVGPPRPLITSVEKIALVAFEPSVTTPDGKKHEGVDASLAWLQALANNRTEIRTDSYAEIYLPKVQQMYVVRGSASPVDVLVVGKKFKVLVKDPKTTRCIEYLEDTTKKVERLNSE